MKSSIQPHRHSAVLPARCVPPPSLVLALCVACSGAPAHTDTTAPAHAFTPTAFSVKVAGTGRPVILIPGLACGGSVWDGTVAHLGDKVQTHVLTLAGFAGQPAIPPPFLATVHDQLVEYIKANKLVRPIVIVHSLGGVMALWLAETDPDVGAVIDVDGLPFLAAVTDDAVTPDKAKEGAAQMQQQIASMPAGALPKMMRQFMTSMITKPDDLDHTMVDVEKSDPTTIGQAFYDLFTLDLRPQLATIKVPLLVVAAGDNGEHSDTTPALWHKQLDAVPHVDLHVVAGAKHFVMLDTPDEFYSLVDGFLAKAR